MNLELQLGRDDPHFRAHRHSQPNVLSYEPGSDVAFTVHYFKNDGKIAVERWVGKLSLAQVVARQAVVSKIACRVEILNAKGVVVFHYPRVMHSA